ncbi:MAG TPA: GNAT family N-acetyltransferase [Solidesulfovibrio sp.]|nr:GNAT family N-acetyltransferase [Solidesulfovibrio sp.]
MDAADAPCLLPWDSAHFGVSMARIAAAGLSPQRLCADLALLRERGAALVEAFCRADETADARILTAGGFALAGVKVYLEHAVGDAPTAPALPEGCRLRIAAPEDTAALVATFGDLFTDSRYFAYPGISGERVRELYRVWLAKAVAGTYDDFCLILEREREPLAVATLKLSGDVARIGLFGVGAAHRRRGCGRLLLAALPARLRPSGVRTVATATQGGNIPALRLYEAAGYLSRSVELCFVRRID